MINVEASHVIVLCEVGELQAVSMANLLGLKGGIQVLDGDHRLRAFGFLHHENK